MGGLRHRQTLIFNKKPLLIYIFWKIQNSSILVIKAVKWKMMFFPFFLYLFILFSVIFMFAATKQVNPVFPSRPRLNPHNCISHFLPCVHHEKFLIILFYFSYFLLPFEFHFFQQFDDVTMLGQHFIGEVLTFTLFLRNPAIETRNLLFVRL